ncbi:unnamed protein product [Orchesella dallaii]|uniref:Uncharacterized protein n=1 Tax=Orchesella dallaii TaxID=48710 RepID=A0ABP1R511_9HEXA
MELMWHPAPTLHMPCGKTLRFLSMTVSKINHGIFQCSKYLRGDASLRIRLMRASPETSIDCATAGTGKTFEPVEFRIEECFMLVRRIVVNPEISQTHQNLLSRGNKLLYSYIDTHMVSYNINSGSMNHISESLQIGPLPNMLCLCLLKSSIYHGNYHKTSYCYQDEGLRSVTLTCKGEEILFKEIEIIFA